MEISKSEIAAVQQAANQPGQDVIQLNDLDLCLIGGGCGDISLG